MGLSIKSQVIFRFYHEMLLVLDSFPQLDEFVEVLSCRFLADFNHTG